MSELRMDAYYYAFDPTGVPEIDRILSAVAVAGKAYHHTEDWNEKPGLAWEGHVGTSYVEYIQNAANDAARLWNTRPADAVREAAKEWANAKRAFMQNVFSGRAGVEAQDRLRLAEAKLFHALGEVDPVISTLAQDGR